MGRKKETEINESNLVFNPGSERNILSICLKEMEKIVEVETEEVQSDYFSVPGHKYIFMAIMYLYSKKIKPTPMSVMEVLSNEKAKNAVDELGGLEYLIILDEASIPTENLNIFIQKVKQSYTRRMLLEIAKEIKEFVISDEAEVLNPAELISFAETKISDLMVANTTTEEVYKMGESTEEVLDRRATHPSQVPGLEVGWEYYDKITNGAQAGDLIVVCAPSKTGKSVVLTNWATKLSIHDQLPILYMDTEMSEREQEDRILANLTGIPQNEIVSGMYVMDTVNGSADEKVAKLKKAREQLKMGNYYHIYMPHFSIEKVNALTKKFAMQMGIVALFFDYIKIPSSSTDFKRMAEYQALGFFTSGLKDLAGTLKIPVFTAAQTNRNDLDGDNPTASDIGGSYRILQLASKLIFLKNKSDEKIAVEGFGAGNQQLFIKYQRNGESDCDPINLNFDKPILRMTEV